MTNYDSDFRLPDSPNASADHLSTATTFGVDASSSSSAHNQNQNYHRRSRNPRKKPTKLMAIMDNKNRAFKPNHGIPKKPDPRAPKITRPCSECGKKFWSWKALFGHMRCHPERQWRGINPPPNFQRQAQSELTQEDHEVAASLLLLANEIKYDQNETDTQSVSSDDRDAVAMSGEADGAGPWGLNCRFECSSCKKVFGSHQALGGHRASHKNVKGCFAITRSDGCIVEEQEQEQEQEQMTNNGASGCGHESRNNDKKMMMVAGGAGAGHKCSICLRVFSSGQALGGHKRCHWEKGESEPSSSISPCFTAPAHKEACGVVVDLNLPPAPPLFEHQHQNDCYSAYSQPQPQPLTLDLRLGL